MQRYETSGDWENLPTSIMISVSDLGNSDYEFLVAVHELIEAYLCGKRGITTEAVDKFDIKFEKNRKRGNLNDPGDCPGAPYYKEHQFASVIEKLLAIELDVDWKKYNDAINRL